jgi:L-sorbose 1-phosphate reductase
MTTAFPEKQYAVQLIGSGKLRLNSEKAICPPGPHQIVAKIECVGLCFSDLKLLKQFSQHPRKSGVVRGIAPEVLAEIPSYVPGELPVVPGHEVTCRIVAVGAEVKHHRVGERCLVQADFRNLPTAGSNAAFGYNFEGGLQEYVLLDERVIIDPADGERFLMPVSNELGASAVALVEPWACVEDSYVNPERQSLEAGGRLLIVATERRDVDDLKLPLSAGGPPATIRQLAPGEIASLPEEGFDDIIYYGCDRAVIEQLNDKLAARGIINVVLGGKRIGADVSVGIGRVHYGMTRWIGTPGSDAAASYRNIPATGELRPGERMIIIGAGGPMGQMHVIRSLSSGVEDIAVLGTDMDDARIASIAGKATLLAREKAVGLRFVNTVKHPLAGEKFSYFALMAPVGALVAQAVTDSLPGALINIFAGIPAPTKQAIDLDHYIANRCYMFGTSGSVIRDMKIVLEKVTAGQLDTDTSVDAVSGMAGAIDGIAAVENRTLAGKIVVYPMLHRLGLTPLHELRAKFPSVADKLVNGQWCKAAEQELLRVAQ